MIELMIEELEPGSRQIALDAFNKCNCSCFHSYVP
jgi:hypothetical protein